MTVSTIEIDAFLCDSVESVNGKMFALGIGWSQISAAQFPVRHGRIGVGLLIRVPYTATNQMHEFMVSLESEDGVTLPLGEAGPGIDPRTVEGDNVVRLGGQFNVGRPPTLPHGDSQIVPIALQLDAIEFPNPGLFNVVVKIDDTEMTRLPFRLTQVHQQQFGLTPS